ncbi:MAG TPA: hypothetical protein VHE12_09470 [bacterium]|nr:hypothetical protein [bacterium]
MEEKQMTQAEKQIRRLEALRQKKDEAVQVSNQDPNAPVRTKADQMADKLMRMREQAGRPSGTKSKRVKIEGKPRSSKLTFNQIGLLERILMEDKELRGSAITRIALNRLLGMENTPLENELEERLQGVLRKFRNRT